MDSFEVVMLHQARFPLKMLLRQNIAGLQKEELCFSNIQNFERHDNRKTRVLHGPESTGRLHKVMQDQRQIRPFFWKEILL